LSILPTDIAPLWRPFLRDLVGTNMAALPVWGHVTWHVKLTARKHVILTVSPDDCCVDCLPHTAIRTVNVQPVYLPHSSSVGCQATLILSLSDPIYICAVCIFFALDPKIGRVFYRDDSSGDKYSTEMISVGLVYWNRPLTITSRNRRLCAMCDIVACLSTDLGR